MNLTSSHYTSYRYVGGHFNTVTFSQTILGNAILKAQYYKSVTWRLYLASVYILLNLLQVKKAFKLDQW